MPEYRVEYTRRYYQTIAAADLKEAERRMIAFRGAFVEGEIKIVGIIEQKEEEKKP